MENTPNNSDKTKKIAKLFLPYERRYEVKIKRIVKNMALEWLHGMAMKFKVGSQIFLYYF